MNPHAFALEPESSVSANSTIWAARGIFLAANKDRVKRGLGLRMRAGIKEGQKRGVPGENLAGDAPFVKAGQ